MHPPTMTIRYAAVDDIPELVRLRRIMWTSMGVPAPGGTWEDACAGVLSDWLRSGSGVAAVVDAGGGALVACGVGSIDQRLPGSSVSSGQYGYIANMVTEPEHRGQGLAGQVLQLLLDWFVARGVDAVELHATPQGEPIYRAFGFTETQQVALRWRSA